MEVLKDKSYKSSSALSRYSAFPYYYNSEDNKYIYGITGHLGQNVTYVAHKITITDTLDSLALKYYGRPDYYWIIADFNRIKDPFIKLYGNYEYMNIPNMSSVSFESLR